ncbi:DUF3592 domain-containing protein [Flavobacterium pectinovorum]|uniref:DUF3592 domain-containing protein n=1 Tax=Flavobacterium pectinovorum TaxID=29533 RepID=A0A502EUW6_9FLAO|nr:DUF3592 domain-containing protein [Flavobacterium pectinovorum]TPG41695.1 DUF3592 domain-containing protein [Flavobacterium pectinovorum]
MNLKKEYSIIIMILFVFFMFYRPVVCFLILGTLLLYYGIDSLIFLNYISKKGIETMGKILAHESDNEGYKTPIIEFLSPEGKLLKGKPHYYAASDLSKFRTYKGDINKNVRILYSLENPEKFVIKTEKSFNYGTIIFVIAVSLIFIGIGIGNILGFLNMEH